MGRSSAVPPEPEASLHVEPEWIAFNRRPTPPDRLDRRSHAAVAVEHAVRDRYDPHVRRCRLGRQAQRLRDREFLALRIERARGYERSCRRPANAGVAMDDQRHCAVPPAHEGDEFGDVLVGRRHISVERLGDVIHTEDEVITRHYGLRPPHEVDVLEEGHDVASTSVYDGFVETGEGADVSHSCVTLVTASPI